MLGAMANPAGNGLKPEFSYAALIRDAFRPELYVSQAITDGYTQAENNFALFWGLAIQAYEATLISNDSRVDQFLEGNTAALTPLEQQGLNEFRNGASQCMNCHMHQGNLFVNPFLGYIWWDQESDGDLMYPHPANPLANDKHFLGNRKPEEFQKQRNPTEAQLTRAIEKNPEAAAARIKGTRNASTRNCAFEETSRRLRHAS